MSQRPSSNDADTNTKNTTTTTTTPPSPEEVAGGINATTPNVSDDDIQFLGVEQLQTVSATIDLCMSPSTSAGAAAATAGTLKSANEQTNLNRTNTAAAADSSNTTTLECPICLQTCIHPARLPCGHIFCFLCVKGVAYKNRRCAMCRREIPPEFLDHPQLVNGIDDICTTKTTEDGYQWYYEGRNGWWQYDDRTSQDIEEAYKKGEKSCTILVAGYVYIVDLESLVQQRQNEPSRCRRVKRDLATIPKKGVAGLRIEGNAVATDLNFATQVYQQQLDQQQRTASLRLPANDIISTIAATDAAIRIASDIIGSTLAHAGGGNGLSADSSDSQRSSSQLLLTAKYILKYCFATIYDIYEILLTND